VDTEKDLVLKALRIFKRNTPPGERRVRDPKALSDLVRRVRNWPYSTFHNFQLSPIDLELVEEAIWFLGFLDEGDASPSLATEAWSPFQRGVSDRSIDLARRKTLFTEGTPEEIESEFRTFPESVSFLKKHLERGED